MFVPGKPFQLGLILVSSFKVLPGTNTLSYFPRIGVMMYKKVLYHWPKVKKTGSGDSRFPAPPVILPLPSEEKKKEEDQVTN